MFIQVNLGECKNILFILAHFSNIAIDTSTPLGQLFGFFYFDVRTQIVAIFATSPVDFVLVLLLATRIV